MKKAGRKEPSELLVEVGSYPDRETDGARQHICSHGIGKPCMDDVNLTRGRAPVPEL